METMASIKNENISPKKKVKKENLSSDSSVGAGSTRKNNCRFSPYASIRSSIPLSLSVPKVSRSSTQRGVNERERLDVEEQFKEMKELISGLQNEVKQLRDEIDNMKESPEKHYFHEYAMDESFFGKRNHKLSTYHVIPDLEFFKPVMLNSLYEGVTFKGSNVQRRIMSILRFTILNIFSNPLYMWGFTASSKKIDIFYPLPAEVRNVLIDFILDTVNLYIPDENSDSYKEFYNGLGDTDSERNTTLEAINYNRVVFKEFIIKSIVNIVTYLREYHFDRKTETLLSCKDKSCRKHFSWKKMKSILEDKNIVKASDVMIELENQYRLYMSIKIDSD